MKRKQIFNPYLPSYEYIPDGEPRVFGDRVYLYGSHDRFGSVGFCLNDYVCYSANVCDLKNWRYEGVIYRKTQDPRNQNIPEDAPEQTILYGIEPQKESDLNPKGIHAMWAPDVAKGPDGRYYLYYCLDFLPEIAVAVSDTPAGQYEFYGYVKHPDGTALGQGKTDLEQFDPGIFVDGEEIYLYSGHSPKSPEYYVGKNASQVMKLQKDMLTLAEEPKLLLPDVMTSRGSGYEGHEFFEASSIRKIGTKYYFVYSSVNSSELCYAVSDRPDEGFQFGGTLIDIGNIGLQGRTRKDAVNALGNTHGGIEQVNGQWYVFYHRQTERTNFNRQACAERIFIDEAGKIAQVEVTSCGLNGEPLEGSGVYPAYICCHLTGKKGAPFAHPMAMGMDYPFLSQDLPDLTPDAPEAVCDAQFPVQYIKNIRDGSTIGYKYFSFHGINAVTLWVRGIAKGTVWLRTQLTSPAIGKAEIDIETDDWVEVKISFENVNGILPLYFIYEGDGYFDLSRFMLERD